MAMVAAHHPTDLTEAELCPCSWCHQGVPAGSLDSTCCTQAWLEILRPIAIISWSLDHVKSQNGHMLLGQSMCCKVKTTMIIKFLRSFMKKVRSETYLGVTLSAVNFSSQIDLGIASKGYISWYLCRYHSLCSRLQELLEFKTCKCKWIWKWLTTPACQEIHKPLSIALQSHIHQGCIPWRCFWPCAQQVLGLAKSEQYFW